MSGSVRKVVLSNTLRERLSVDTVGTGGYQSLVQEIQKRLRGATLAVDDELTERIEHYAFDYGSGGWQLDRLLKEKSQIGDPPPAA